MTDTPKTRRNKHIVKNIFNDHQYSVSPEVAIDQENKYLTLKENILKGFWNIEVPSLNWTIYCNEKSNKVVFIYVEHVENASNVIMPLASKYVSFL